MDRIAGAQIKEMENELDDLDQQYNKLKTRNDKLQLQLDDIEEDLRLKEEMMKTLAKQREAERDRAQHGAKVEN